MPFPTTILGNLFPDTKINSSLLRKILEKKFTIRFEDCEWHYEEQEEQANLYFKRVPDNLKVLFAFAEQHCLCHSRGMSHAPTSSNISISKERSVCYRERERGYISQYSTHIKNQLGTKKLEANTSAGWTRSLPLPTDQLLVPMKLLQPNNQRHSVNE